MKTKTNVKVAEAINYIEQLCESQNTGTIFMMTKKGVIAQMKLAEGDIADIHYLTERGMTALAHIFESTYFTKITFLKKGKSPLKRKIDSELPAQNIIWEYIRNIGGGSRPKNGVTIKEEQRVEEEGVEEANPDKKINLTKVINNVSPELTIHLGPMAPILCKRYFKNAKNQAELMGALDRVANEIGDVVERAKFKQRMQKKIQHL